MSPYLLAGFSIKSKEASEAGMLAIEIYITDNGRNSITFSTCGNAQHVVNTKPGNHIKLEGNEVIVSNENIRIPLHEDINRQGLARKTCK